MVRYNQRWVEMEKSGTPFERLFESYALFNRPKRKTHSRHKPSG